MAIVDSPITTGDDESCSGHALLCLKPGEVHVWYVGIDETGIAPPVDSAIILSAEEEGRRTRFVFEKDRRLFLVSHLLVRSVLSKYAPVAPAAWQFRNDDGGKPRIAGPEGIPPLRFNLSHTRGLAAVAVTLEDEVGVDVERITSPADMKLAETCFADDELAWLKSSPAEEQADRFFELWTLKEAYLKARGTGLSLPLKEFSMRAGSVADGVACPRSCEGMSGVPEGADRLVSEDSSATTPETEARSALPRPPAQAERSVSIAFRGSIVDDPATWQFHRCRITPQHALAVAFNRPASTPMQVTLLLWR